MVLLSYTQALMPGMTRKEVEGYLQAKNVQFVQKPGVDPSEVGGRSSWDDLLKIGEEKAPWYCSENWVYVAFLFTDYKHLGVFEKKGDDLDILKAVTIYHDLGGCL
jgi:hypothetical protein